MDETTASTEPTATTDSSPEPTSGPPLLQIVRGRRDAGGRWPRSVAVFAALSSAQPPARRPVRAWSAPHRGVRRTLPHGPGGWRSSALPR